MHDKNNEDLVEQNPVIQSIKRCLLYKTVMIFEKYIILYA